MAATMIPRLSEMFRELVASPSISSNHPALDQGNRPVIDLLAGWLDNLGFDIEVMPLPGRLP